MTFLSSVMLLQLLGMSSSFVPFLTVPGQGSVSSLQMSSQLEQLASMTVLSIDSGDLDVIRKYADTGLITDATTNPLFVAQAGLSGDKTYTDMVDASVASSNGDVGLAIDTLAVTLGTEISKIVPGFVSTEVDPRLSFDTATSLSRARRIIGLYEKNSVDKSRVLIKLAATWEGIEAARVLEKEGITCNLTLVFGKTQAIACAQAGVKLISPFPGRILDYYKLLGRDPTEITDPEMDEGVIAVKSMHHYYKNHGHEGTILMPASWRPSRGTSDPNFMLDEIRALAGVDRMTIPPPLLEKLAESTDTLERQLSPEKKSVDTDLAGPFIKMDEKTFRYELNNDGCSTFKMAEGLRAFIGETEKLQAVMEAKIESAVAS